MVINAFLDHFWVVLNENVRLARILWTITKTCSNPKCLLELWKNFQKPEFQEKLMRTLFLHGPTVWKVMPRNAWSDIVSWPTGQLNNSTKYLLNDVSLPVLWGRSLHELRSHWQSLIYELHQCSSHWHHEVLDEEDDECHLLYWWKRIGSGRSSPDSRWRRCIFVSASRKSDRSFIGAFLPDLFMVKNQFSDLSNSPGSGQ